MPTLSLDQFSLVANLMSLCVAAMGAATAFFFFSRSQVAPKYRPAMLITALVTFIACYHYFRIYDSFSHAYTLVDGVKYVASGVPFNDAYRYADWLLTVPLLVIELVAVLALAKDVSRKLIAKLATAALLMIALGYPGEVATEAGTKWMYWGAAMLPFFYILYVLFTEFSQAYVNQPENVKKLVGGARSVILITWSFYPVAFLAPMLGIGGAEGEVLLQCGYTVADILAKVGMGVYIYFIAVAKTEADGYDIAQGTDSKPTLQAV